MILWKLLVGIALVLFSVVSVIVSIIRTPENLRGFYGVMFGVISLAGVVGGIVLIVTSFV